MIKVKFLYSKIADIPDFQETKEYEKKGIRLDYEHYYERGQYYNLWGILVSAGITYFYIDTGNDYQRLEQEPAVLFDKVDWSNIPKDWQICIEALSDFKVEIIPSTFASIDYWFWRYTDDDDEVVEIVNHELNKVASPVEDPSLKRLLSMLYKENTNKGYGSTSEAIRYNLKTEALGSENAHVKKANEAVTFLYKWLQSNSNVYLKDRAVAENVLSDLKDSLNTKK